MKVISVLFSGLLFCGAVVVNSAFAEDYGTSWTTVRKTCVRNLTLAEELNKVKQGPISCRQNDENNEEVLATAQDWKGSPGSPQLFLHELVRTPTGFVIRVTECEARGPGQGTKFGTPVVTPYESASPYSLQKIAPKSQSNISSSSPDGSKAAPPHRLFTTGPNTAASRNDYVAYTLDSNDIPTSAKKVIFSNPNTKTSLGGSAAPDGGMAVQLIADSSKWTMVTRRMKDGVPAGAPFTWTVPPYNGYSPDLTNAIEVNSGVAGASAQKIRYLVFRSFHNVGTTGQASQIMIQTIDDATGKPLGDAKPLTSSAKAFIATAEAIQSIAIAPDGNLMLFTVYSDACKRQILKMVKLANGSTVGGATTVVGCSGLAATPAGVVGLDIMFTDETASSSK